MWHLFLKKRLRLFVYQCNSWICECWRLRACVCVKGEERQCACVCVGVCVCDRESAAWGSVTCILDHMCHFLHREKKILRNNWKDAPTILNIKNQNLIQLVNSFSTKAIEESSLAAPTQQSLREVNWHLRLKVRIDVLLGVKVVRLLPLQLLFPVCSPSLPVGPFQYRKTV